MKVSTANIVPLWIGAHLAEVLFSIAFFLLVRALSPAHALAATVVAPVFSSIVVSLLEWLVLRDAGAKKIWVLASAIVRTLRAWCLAFAMVAVVAQLRPVLGFYLPGMLVGLVGTIALALVQWPNLPPRFARRRLWLLALPAATLCTFVASFILLKLDYASMSGSLHDAINAVIVGLVGGLALRQMMLARALPPATTN